MTKCGCAKQRCLVCEARGGPCDEADQLLLAQRRIAMLEEELAQMTQRWSDAMSLIEGLGQVAHGGGESGRNG